MPLRGEMDNRVNGLPEHLACLTENVGNDIPCVNATPCFAIQLCKVKKN